MKKFGTLQTECLDYLIGPMSVSELQAEIDSWLKNTTHTAHTAHMNLSAS